MRAPLAGTISANDVMVFSAMTEVSVICKETKPPFGLLIFFQAGTYLTRQETRNLKSDFVEQYTNSL